MKNVLSTVAIASFGILLASCNSKSTSGDSANSGGKIKLLNVSYDPTRELYEEFNKSFIAEWKKTHQQDVEISQSHGGSGKQARAVIDGLSADVVTLALAGDIDSISKKSGKIPTDWQSKLPHQSSPYTSTIVFIVRKGNPKQIRDWADLVKGDNQVITPNPKTGGGARWNYLAAWAWGKKQFAGDETQIRNYLTQLFKHVPVLESGARSATTTFAQREIGDVLLSWENEAHLIEKEFPGKFEIILPSISILAEPPVAVVEKVTDKKGTTAVAKAYLEYLYSDKGQEIVASHFYRPSNPAIAQKFATQFPQIPLVTIQDFGGWTKAQADHFADGAIFDQITQK